MMNKKKTFLVFSFLWFILLCFCEENTGDWTLVPQYFSGNEVYKEIIPTLILKSFPENISRVLTYEEEEFLNLKNLEKEKKAKEIKINELQRKKDLIFFQTKTEAEKHKASAVCLLELLEGSEKFSIGFAKYLDSSRGYRPLRGAD